MATKFETAGNLVRKVKNIMKNLPDWIRIASITTDNRTSFELSTLVFLEALIGEIVFDKDLTEEGMRGVHANLE